MCRNKSFDRVVNKIKSDSYSLLSRMRMSFDAIDYFTNKSVVILGPVSVVNNTLLSRIEKADICVFVNKGYRLKSFELIKESAKEIVLFHCLDQSEKTGGGVIDTRELRRRGFQEIFYPLYENRFQENIDTFHKNNSGLLKLVRVKETFYEEVRNAIGGFTPNTGAATIYVTSAAPGAKVYVHGITFYRTAYLDEYAPHLANLSETIKMIETYGNHNPDMELLYFKSLLNTRNIEVDDELQTILRQPYESIFYKMKNEMLSENES